MTLELVSHAVNRTKQRGFCDQFLEVFYSLTDSVKYSHGRECLGVTRISLENALGSRDLSFDAKCFIKQNYKKILNTVVVQQDGLVITIKRNRNSI